MFKNCFEYFINIIFFLLVCNVYNLCLSCIVRDYHRNLFQKFNETIVIQIIKMCSGPSDRSVWVVGLDRLVSETVGSNPA
jgi:hypothetical protein